MKSGHIVFFGNERLGTGLKTSAPVLKSLLSRDYKVVALVLPKTRTQTSPPLEVTRLARHHQVPVLAGLSQSELYRRLISLGPTLGILVAYGSIVPQTIISLFPRGIINLHPSLLPRYRGPSPIEQTILDGTVKTGVSLMQLTSKLDAGPIMTRASLSLSAQETKPELASRLLKLGTELLLKSLPQVLNGSIQTRPQDESGATYTPLIRKSDGQIDWHSSAAHIERQVRAYLGWPGSHTSLANKDVIVTKASVGPPNSGHNDHQPGDWFVTNHKKLAVQTGKGILTIEELKPVGKTEMGGEDFLHGLPN